MKFWFTADTHFGHGNIIKYCNRPFRDAYEMNQVLITNWNTLVEPDDIVYHLGDFCFARMDEAFDVYMKQLNGKIVFIEGNHDKLPSKNKNRFLAYHKFHETYVLDQHITMCHFAMKVWNHSHHGSWHLYGHSHGTLPDDPNSMSMDVGVDTNNYKPYSFEQIKAKMKLKTFKPIDHHGEKKETP